MQYQTFIAYAHFQDVDQSKTLEAFEVDRSKIELQGQIGQGEFGRQVQYLGPIKCKVMLLFLFICTCMHTQSGERGCNWYCSRNTAEHCGCQNVER